MNLFLTGEFKQCKTGKRVLEDYLKNYNQFNQGLILDFVIIIGSSVKTLRQKVFTFKKIFGDINRDWMKRSRQLNDRDRLESRHNISICIVDFNLKNVLLCSFEQQITYLK